jgi:hypothetical protein
MHSSSMDRMSPKHRTAVAVLSVTLLIFAVSASLLAEAEKEPLVIVKNGKYGFIDHDGKIVIPPQFIWADGDFWHGLATVYVCGRYVSINSSGTLLPLRIAVPGKLEPDKKGTKFGFVDATGKFKIEPVFDDVLPFSGGYAAVRVGEKWGFVDTAARVVIHPQFKAAYFFREGVATAELDSGIVLINILGRVIAQGYHFVQGIVADGRVPASRGERSGYLDLQGKPVIPFIYDAVDTFSEGLAAVKKQGKWGHIDRDGKLVIPLKFDKAGPFANGLAPVKIGTTSGFIDKSGKFSFYLAFEHAPGFLESDEEGIFRAPSDTSRFWTEDHKFGIVNTSGKVIWGPIEGSPDHAPLWDWSDEDKVRSCEGVPEAIRNKIAGFLQR